MKVALAQIASVWLNKEKTTVKVLEYISQAADEKCDLVIFGEAVLPAYPFWLSITNGATFNDQIQKEIHAHYIKNAVCIEDGDLSAICKLAKDKSIAVYLGAIEAPKDRGGHSLYCTLIYIDANGIIQSSHRKIRPTFEERLVWSPGDGHGLVTHQLQEFTLGGLNCWENWMPLSRTALYAQGENVHVAVWPGCVRNTVDITPFIAKESRSYSISVCGLFGKEQITNDIPHYDMIQENCPTVIAEGGSCIAAPDGSWVIEPIANQEGIFTAELDFNKVLQERQNFDPVGHYSRPDITRLSVNRERQSIAEFKD